MSRARIADERIGENTGTGWGMKAPARKEAGMLGVRQRLATAVVFGLLFSSPVLAHPGHGRDGGDFSALHYLSEPMHLFVVLPLLVLAALAARYLTGILRPSPRRQGSK
jgi:hypothetical protein